MRKSFFENAYKMLKDASDNYENFQIILPKHISDGISKIIEEDHLTFRYILFTALLAKSCSPEIHTRALQAQARLPGAYDARSLCHSVVVPFEKNFMAGRLGNSNEPYLNKPARFETVEKTNAVRAGKDKELLCCLYDLLEEINETSPMIHKKAFEYAFYLTMQRPVRTSENIILPEIEISAPELVDNLSMFLGRSYEGQAPVAIFGALLTLFHKDAEVKIHPTNEAGASSKEIGDIDVLFPTGSVYAVEVKDKPFSETDVDHATEKAMRKKCSKVIFALGNNCGKVGVNMEEISAKWARRGIDLSFASIHCTLHNIVSMAGPAEYSFVIRNTWQGLYDMRAKDIAIREFEELFGTQT